MDISRQWMTASMVALTCGFSAVARGQLPALGPTQSVEQRTATPWPTKPPARIYVTPFAMEPGLQEQLQQQAQGGILPTGPVRQMLASRPRAIDMVTGYDRSQPVGTNAAKMLADELVRAGLPAVAWNGPLPPPADGWWVNGQIVSLDEGSAAARNLVGFGAGNKTIGVDIMVSDPGTAGGQPFFVLDSTDKGRRMPGTVAVGAVAGFNPYVVVGRAVASQSGIADVTQQQRLAQEVTRSLIEAFEAHARQPAASR